LITPAPPTAEIAPHCPCHRLTLLARPSAKGVQLGKPENLRDQEIGRPARQAEATPPQSVAILSEREQALRAMLKAVREHVTQNADYVGSGFAEEARKMHYGEIEHRSIYGVANPVEAKALLEEGIEVHPLPIVPDKRN